ncbi:hypothetical protein V6Z12_A11G213500 [Gossypium hirsutum]
MFQLQPVTVIRELIFRSIFYARLSWIHNGYGVGRYLERSSTSRSLVRIKGYRSRSV